MPTTTNILNHLDADWTLTANSGRARRALRTWSNDPAHGELFAATGNPHDVIETLHASTGTESDPLLIALIEFAQAGDEIAARLLLQAFVPLVGRLSGGTRRGDLDYQSDVASILAEMIATFPLDTHSHHVASHLAFMVRRGLHRRHRRKYVTTISLDDDTMASVVDIRNGDRSPDGRTAADRVACIVSDCRNCGVLDDEQARILLLVAAGHKVAELARHAGCHRSRMGARVAKATAATADFAVAA